MAGFIVENNSGMGKEITVPDVISKRFNWGAFLLSWIWGIGNRTYIPLCIIVAYFIPFLGILICLGLQIWFGFKGNEWAWRNKYFESVEHFHTNQKKWAVAGIVVSGIGIALNILGVLMLLMLSSLNVE